MGWRRRHETELGACRWTQEEVAAKEGKTQFWVSTRLCFGRFLNFIAADINAESLPSNLSERFLNFPPLGENGESLVTAWIPRS